jgi:cytochrome c-type biogenesis protein
MEVTVLAAFIAGVISFLSPCVLPLIPAYISVITGLSLDKLKRRTVLTHSLLFILGFSVVFLTLGASATWLGEYVGSHIRLFRQVAGLALIVMGVHLTGLIKINILYRDKRFHGKTGNAFVAGLAFSIGWMPCTGPILASILALASEKETLSGAMGLLAVYSAGLAIPFLLTGLALNPFLRLYTRFKRHLPIVEIASGIFVIALGIKMLV